MFSKSRQFDADSVPQKGLWKLHVSEEGTMAQVTVIVMLGFTMLLGVVGNIGRIVQKKVAVQNAADSVAYSTALWQARSMNAVTAINHMLGELTSICVLHEALGGPQLDDGIEETSDEFKDLNRKIKGINETLTLEVEVPIGRFPQVPPFLHEIDKKIVKYVMKIVTNDDGKTFSGATIYDARVTLKQLVAYLHDAKKAGNALLLAGQIPFLAFLIPIGYGIHAAATPILIDCGKEAGLLLVVEAGAVMFVEPKHLLEEEVMPILARYPEDLLKSGGVLGTSIENTLKDLEGKHVVQGSVFPSPNQIQLPIVAEEAPQSGSGGEIRSQSIGSSWLDVLSGLLGKIGFADDIVGFFNDVVEFIPGVEEITGWSVPGLPPESGDGSQENPTRKSLKRIPADWETEETTRWVRASYPWVDSLRSPIMGGMSNPLVLMLSKSAVWYGHWTNRLMIAKSYSYRSGTPLSKLGGSRDPMKMFVMRDMKPDRKGQESWTNDSPEAERLFTVMGFTTHQVDALFSPVVFGASRHEQVAYAQAMYYNANPQEPGNSGGTQPRVGWDTLNWAPPVNVPEYGSMPHEEGSLWPPWDMFEKVAHNNTPAIKLNWQAKLVPITRSRLSQASSGGSYKGNIRELIGKGLLNTRQLDTH